jgi:hypothetical protein
LGHVVGRNSWSCSLLALNPEFLQDDCRYAVYDFDYKLADGGERSKLLFIVW